MRNFIVVIFLGLFSTLHCQENYKVSDINLKMLLNANAVVREHHTEIEIENIDDVEIFTYRVVTVLNESGETFINAYENFDKGRVILDQEAVILNAEGDEIRKFKKRDFNSQSNFQNFVLFSDNKVSYLEYTPRKYPYTVIYSSRIRTESSAFLPDWWPVEGYKVSVEKSFYKIINEERIPIRFTERKLDGLAISKEYSKYELDYTAEDIPAKSYEELSPSFRNSSPRLMVALEEFSLEGILGKATNWEDFGKWQYDNLVAGQGDLSGVIVSKVSGLTQNAKTKEEKARIIYKYVQDNTRYIAVMLGIGGWKPYNAQEVDRLGYGDCKGLTNFTKALLASQGIESDYTVIYGGPKRDIDPEFTKMQGNHVILSIPMDNKDDIWLECTSQDAPFNYLGDFTDDRYAVKIKPTGGEIVRTKKYTAEDNLQKTSAEIKINENGGFDATLNRYSYGVPYGDIYLLELQTEDVKMNYYRENWPQFQNVMFDSIILKNDKNDIEFSEKLRFQANRFCSNAGDRLLIPLNFIENFDLTVEKDKNRENPIQILRGKSYQNQFRFILPEGYTVEALPGSKELQTEFGTLKLKISVENEEDTEVILVERNLQIEEGEWAPEKFKKFKDFINQIHHLSNRKAVIAPINKA
ncbi:DUF3857 domain-containing protein [Christiangramia echinicola]|uniref:DUF3857 domain-containing protein n=1 Tax=Christiangramia echinicola TaxID=279359 RepID=UPI0004015F5A|nr:DUF3857 domain-containing protein [Christiangramia echinicola]